IKGVEKVEDPAARVKKLVADPGKAGAFAWRGISRSLAYAGRRVGGIAGSGGAIGEGQRWGYNWELGPVGAWGALGVVETAERMQREGVALPASIQAMREAGAASFYKDDEVWDLCAGKYVARRIDPRTATLAEVRRGDKPVLANDGAEAWDLGDGV